MYALKNQVQLIGNLGNTPDVRLTDKGRKWARFTMATNESYRGVSGEMVKSTQWHSLVAWGKIADIAEKYLAKGTGVLVSGKLVNRSYVDKDGVKKYITDIQVSDILLLGAGPRE